MSLSCLGFCLFIIFIISLILFIVLIFHSQILSVCMHSCSPVTFLSDLSPSMPLFGHFWILGIFRMLLLHLGSRWWTAGDLPPRLGRRSREPGLVEPATRRQEAGSPPWCAPDRAAPRSGAHPSLPRPAREGKCPPVDGLPSHCRWPASGNQWRTQTLMRSPGEAASAPVLPPGWWTSGRRPDGARPWTGQRCGCTAGQQSTPTFPTSSPSQWAEWWRKPLGRRQWGTSAAGGGKSAGIGWGMPCIPHALRRTSRVPAAEAPALPGPEADPSRLPSSPPQPG